MFLIWTKPPVLRANQIAAPKSQALWMVVANGTCQLQKLKTANAANHFFKWDLRQSVPLWRRNFNSVSPELQAAVSSFPVPGRSDLWRRPHLRRT